MKALRLLALLLAAAVCHAQAPKPVRVALVIGNGDYKHAVPLSNPLHDAADIAKELEAAGFTVIRRDNATLREMHLALREFGDKLTRNATGVFYFAGHGVQVRGRNFLLPVDADIAREDEVAFATLDLAAVMEKLDSARNPVNIVILDACRDNPFGSRLQVTSKGLAQVEAPPGTLIAFATAPGSAASDGGGRNGLYTGHLLAAMRKRGSPIEETFKMVRASVRRDSHGRQVPWESTSLETHFTFRAPPPPPKKKVEPAKVAAGDTQRKLVAASAPPTFAPGDTWTYRLRNLLDESERTRTMAVADVRDGTVTWKDGAHSDLLGNFTKLRKGENWHTYAPSSHMYVFPLNAGAKFTLPAKEISGGKRNYDLEVSLAVIGEEDVDTPAGKFRAVKMTRVVKWAEPGKPANSGVNRWTYWYSGQAKRWVAAEQSNATTAGKQLQLERWDLESYSVR